MNLPPKLTPSVQQPARQWLAQLNLSFQKKAAKTTLARVSHLGPLRVQRPFYPEGPECCHVYLLHPPGGMVVGDELTLQLAADAQTHALLTTPSAGKLYAVPGGGETQTQTVTIDVGEDSHMEWLPQETLVFDGANGLLKTQFHLAKSANIFAWDIVCLGRPASHLPFNQGRCLQQLEVWQDDTLQWVEKNLFEAGSAATTARWGMYHYHTSGTLLATVKPSRTDVDQWLAHLDAHFGVQQWGLTQKQDLFIARYRGNSALACRRGFEWLWHALRPKWCNRPAVVPRIWHT